MRCDSIKTCVLRQGLHKYGFGSNPASLNRFKPFWAFLGLCGTRPEIQFRVFGIYSDTESRVIRYVDELMQIYFLTSNYLILQCMGQLLKLWTALNFSKFATKTFKMMMSCPCPLIHQRTMVQSAYHLIFIRTCVMRPPSHATHKIPDDYFSQNQALQVTMNHHTSPSLLETVGQLTLFFWGIC